MTENEKKQIKELWASGMPLSRIRRMVAVTPSEFRKGAAEMRKSGELGVDRKTTVQKVCEAFDNGDRNAKAIAERYGLSETTVRIYLRTNGRHFGKKTRNWVHSDRTLAIVEDLNDGVLSQYAIAKKHGVSRQYLTKIKKKWEKGILDYGKSN